MNLSPSLPHEGNGQHPLPTGALDVMELLAPVRRAIGMGRVLRWAALGFAVGAAVGIALVAAAHVAAFGSFLPAGLLPAIAGCLAGIAYGVSRWPGPLEAARAVDRHFDLDDRLTTALELRSTQTPPASVLRRDVASHVDGLPLRQSRGTVLTRREGAITAVAALALAAALAIGTPAHSHRTARVATTDTQAAKRSAAAQVQKLAAKLNAGLTPQAAENPALRKLNAALARLRKQLLNAPDRRSALQAISATQQQLRQQALQLHPVNSRAVAQLNSSLGRYTKGAQAGNGKGASAQSMLAEAQALNRLARSLAHLTPSQRSALARALAQAANSTSDTNLRSSLQQAASSLGYNDPQTAKGALQAAAQSLAGTPGQQSALSQLNAASGQLDSVKNGLAGLSAGGQQGQPGAPRAAGGRGNGSKPGSFPGNGSSRGRGPGTGRGLQGQRGQGRGSSPGRGRGTGRGTGRGQGQGSTNGGNATSGQGTAGSHGRGGQGRSGRTRPGRSVTVYIPGQQGKGAQVIQTGPNGAPLPGALVPYDQVIGRYAQSAHQALDRAALPPSLQTYVHKYFSSISP